MAPQAGERAGSSGRDDATEVTERLKRQTESSDFSRTGSFSVSGEDTIQQSVVTRKLNWHILSRFCLLTMLNHMDRANLAYASTQLNSDLGYSDSVYGFASGVFFLGYMIFQIPSQLVAERVGLVRWISLLLIAWGVVATSFAGLTRSHAHLYTLRFLLGATEAGTFPAMWAHLTHFYAGGPGLAAAWGFIGAAQPLAQVLGSPVASAFIMTDGFLGLAGWQWLFLMEGIPTILLGIWIWTSLAPSPAEAKFLTPHEREHVSRQIRQNKEAMKKETGEQHWTHGLFCWKVYAQGFGSGGAGILRYGAMYWTPLIVYSIVNGNDDPSVPHTPAKSAAADLLSGIPYSWAAAATLLNSWHAKKSGKMYWYCIGPLSVGSVGLLVLAFSLGRLPWLAFFGLMLSATSQASNPLEWSYPATYLHGAALSTGWAVANCVTSYGGWVGPWMIGLFKDKYGSYVVPLLILAIINTAVVGYFAVLLLHLPIRKMDNEERPQSSDDVDDSLAMADSIERGRFMEDNDHR